MDDQDIFGAREQLGDTAKIHTGLERFKANIDFFEHNYSSLMEKYPNKWVAIQDENVVATSRSLSGLMSILKKAGVETSSCYIQFLDPNPKLQILTAQQARELSPFLIS